MNVQRAYGQIVSPGPKERSGWGGDYKEVKALTQSRSSVGIYWS